jgi:hypothetical protein
MAIAAATTSAGGARAAIDPFGRASTLVEPLLE